MTTPQIPAEFSQFFLEDAARFELDLPTGAPMLYNGAPVAVHLFGPATSQFIAAKDKKERDASARVYAGIASQGKNEKDTSDADADNKFLCAITSSFENFPYPGGAEAIYREPHLIYINHQVNRILANLGNFFPKPNKS